MARGQPDYNSPDYVNAFSNDVPDQSFVSEFGVSPLVNGGRVYYVDFFDSLLYGWDSSISGAGIAPVVKTTQKRVLTRPYSVLLDPGGNAGQSAILRDISTFIDSKHGVEWILTSDANHGHWQFTFQHVRVDGIQCQYILSYNVLTGAWRIGTPTGGTTFRTEVFAGTFQQRFVRVKIVYNVATGNFDSFYLGDSKHDLSAYASTQSGSTSVGFSRIQFVTIGANATWEEPTYVSGVIWTVDEP